jgi:hypothetical protein
MSFQSPYAYLLTIEGQPPAVFTWPNACKKFLRDTWEDEDGVLKLPPPGYLVLKRYKVNPKAGQALVIDIITDIARFVSGPDAT